MIGDVDDTQLPVLDGEAGRQRELLNQIMRRQASLSLRVAAIFAAILLALPLVNLYAPAVSAVRIGGFSVSWLLLAVLFYPITWALSIYFVRTSESLESDIAQSMKGMRPSESGSSEPVREEEGLH